MGFGIFSIAKGLLLFLVYGAGFVCAARALTGKIHGALYLVLFLMPLRNVVEKIYGLPLGKDFIDILFLSMIVGSIVAAHIEKRPLFQKSPLNTPAFTIAFYTYVSLWVGYGLLGYYAPFNFSDPRLQDCKNFILFPILFMIILNNVRDKKGIVKVLIVIFLGMMASGWYTLKQVTWFLGIVSRNKIHGTFVFVGPNEVAAFFNQYGVFFLALSLFWKNKLQKIFMLGLVVMSFYSVLFLFSRGAYLGLLTGLFVLFSMRKKVLLIPLVLLVIFWQTALPATVRERIEMTTNEAGELDVSTQMRLVVWQEAMRLFQENPILGTGFHVFKYLGFELGDTHNIYVRILAEQGLIGMFIFLWLITAFFRQAWRLYKQAEDPELKGLGLAFVICLIVFVVNNFFGNRWDYLELSSYLWAIAALVTRGNLILSSEKTQKSSSGKQNNSSKNKRSYKTQRIVS